MAQSEMKLPGEEREELKQEIYKYLGSFSVHQLKAILTLLKSMVI